MYVIVTYKERGRTEKAERESAIIPTDVPTQVVDGILVVLHRNGDWHKIPLDNIHEWRERF